MTYLFHNYLEYLCLYQLILLLLIENTHAFL